jgi:hypothetical protein
MQRLRAGLAGLGLVFLVVMVASILFAPVRPVTESAPGEPLAQLGVAPGPTTKPAAALPAAIPPAP